MNLLKNGFRKKILKSVARTFITLILAAIPIYFLIGIIKQESASLLEKRSLIQSLQNRDNVASVLREGYKEVRAHVDLIGNAALSSNNISPFISALESLAKETGNNQESFTFISSSPATPVGSQSLNKIDYEVVVLGNHEGFLNYVSSFEKLPFLAKINNLELLGVSGLDASSKMILKGEIYVK